VISANVTGSIDKFIAGPAESSRVIHGGKS
jgi:hypothetical protein